MWKFADFGGFGGMRGIASIHVTRSSGLLGVGVKCEGSCGRCFSRTEIRGFTRVLVD